MSETPNLSLPYIVAAQAQKHVTHNEAIRTLDAVVQLSVLDRDLTSPPSSPSNGDRYIVANPATGNWAGNETSLAAYQDDAWVFFTPLEGWLCWVADEDKLLAFDGTTWDEITNSNSNALNPTPLVGVNATADTTNRLAVNSPNTLLNHEGSDHRVNINKAAETDTASLVFKESFSGRAEIGLTGDDDFHFKVSPNGNTWHEALIIDKDSGELSFPAGIANPILSGAPKGGLNNSDALYIDAINGNDANSGTSLSNAIKTPAALTEKLPIGRAVTLYVMSDLIWDYIVVTRYPIHSLQIFGLSADGSTYAQRKITVKNATNHSGLPGGIMFFSPSVVYMSGIDIDLDTDRNYAFLLFSNTMAYFRTAGMTLTRLGSGACVLFANGASFVPSQHSNLTIDTSASGFVANGVSAGANPNNHWQYPSNITSF